MVLAKFTRHVEVMKSQDKLAYPEFSSIRSKYAYAVFSTVPDVLLFVAMLAQYTDDLFNTYTDGVHRLFRKLQKVLTSPVSQKGLTFVHIHPDTAKVVVCIDTAFAVSIDKSSQLGALVIMRDRMSGSVNFIHFASYKSKRFCKSVRRQNSSLSLMASQ